MRAMLKASALLAACMAMSMTRAAGAEEAPPVSEATLATAPTTAQRTEQERARQRYRLSLGVQPGLRAVVGTGDGLGGGLGGGPMTTASFEVRLGGPAWLVLETHGRVASDEGNGATSSGWSTGGAAGLRLERPVFDFVSVGGHGLVLGDVSRSVYEGPTGDGTSMRNVTKSFEVGAALGADLHFRVSSFFGIRLSLEMLRVGHRSVDDAFYDLNASSTFAQLTASPRVALTFTF